MLCIHHHILIYTFFSFLIFLSSVIFFHPFVFLFSLYLSVSLYDEVIVIFICFLVFLSFGVFYEVKNKDLCGDHVRSSVTYYQRLNRLSDFHEIRYGRLIQNVV
jgi:hypothetical protein